MAYQYVQSGNPLQLELILPDGSTGLFPQAVVLNSVGAQVAGSPFSLTSQGFGLYAHRTFVPANGAYVCIFIVYTDAGHTTESPTYGRSSDHFQVDSLLTQSTQNTSNATAIKAKTDQLTFTGLNVNANAQVVSDKTNYQLTAAQVAAIEAGVWDVEIASHASPGSTGEALSVSASLDPNQIASAVWDTTLLFHVSPGSTGKALQDSIPSPVALASAVWDELFAGHTIGGSFGDLVQAIKQDGAATTGSLNSGVSGLAAIKASVVNGTSATIAEVNQNEVKINAIIPAITASQVVLTGEIDQNQVLIEALSSQLTSTGNDLAADIAVVATKVDAVGAQVETIQNNTTVRFVVPDRIVKPLSGSKTYQVQLRLYDDTGFPEAPTSTPTIRIKRLDTGANVVLADPMTQDGVKVGAYYYDWTVTAGTDTYAALIEATVVEGGGTRYVPAVTEITEYDSDLDEIQAQLTAVQNTVVTTQLAVGSGVYGLAALKTGQNDIVTEINQNETQILAIKAKTDLLPVDVASAADVAALAPIILSRPSIGDITTQLNLVRDYITGPDNKNITQVYNKIDLTPVMKTNDPRLNNLDATISSRTTDGAPEVWAYGSRSLTSFSLPVASIKAIWDYLTSQASAAGSMGKFLTDNLDVKVSTRATSAQVASALAGVAQEATVSTLAGLVTSGDNQTQIDVASVQSDVTAIKAKTQNLPSDPVSASIVTGGFSAQSAAIANLDLKTTGIKAKTDNLPPDPAKETSVLSRPTNPVLATDLRLSRLDVPVSTRGTLDAADIAGLATSAGLASTQTALTTEINQNETKLDTTLAKLDLVKARTDLIPAQPVSKAQLDAAVAEIITEIDDTCGGGGSGGATAAEVWSYPSRTITQDPQSFGPDISDLATKQDVQDISLHTAECQMSTTLNSTSGTQEVLVWLEKDGEVFLASSDASVTIKDRAGITLWTASLASPTADGAFAFSVVFVPPDADQNYYIDISISDGTESITTRKAFITVG